MRAPVNDEVTLSAVGAIVHRRWRVLTALTLLGALLAAGLWLVVSPGHTSTSKILLQGGREEQELAGEALIATTLTVLDRAAAEVDWDVTGRQLQGAVAASVGDGNVIEISVTAPTSQQAQLLAERVTAAYIDFSGQIVTDAADAEAADAVARRELVQRQVDELNAQLDPLRGSPLLLDQTPAGAQARAQFDQLTADLDRLTNELDDLADAAGAAGAQATLSRGRMIVIEPPAPGTAASPTLVQLVIGGAVSTFAIATLGYVLAARGDRRLRSRAEIAAALGAPVLSEVVVAAPAHREQTDAAPEDLRSRIQDLLRHGADWDTAAPVADAGQDETVRFRRLLARLRGAPDARLRVVVLVADDDPVARRAVALLAAAAATDGDTVSVVTDDAELTELVRAGDAQPGSGPVLVRTTSHPAPKAHRTVLRVLRIDGDRPTVPDAASVTGVLVVVSAGTRTSWQLVAIGGACIDAGHSVLGALLVTPCRPSDPAPTPAPTPSTSAANGSVLAGST